VANGLFFDIPCTHYSHLPLKNCNFCQST